MADRGLSSRAVLISLAVVAVGIVGALIGLTDGKRPADPGSSASSESRRSDLRSTLEETSKSPSTRTETSETKAPAPPPPTAAKSLVVSGTVIDARSRAGVPDVDLVGFSPEMPDGRRASGDTVTDAQGRYSLVIPWDGSPGAVDLKVTSDRIKHLEVRVDHERFQPDRNAEGRLSASQDIEVVTVLALRGRLVRESDGSPVRAGWKSASLVLVEKAPALPRTVPTLHSFADASDQFLIQVEEMIPGELAVLGSAEGYLARMKPASFDPDRVVDIGDIALPEGACIDGFVSTADGSRPLATHVWAELEVTEGTWMHLEDGSWTVRGDVLVPLRSRAKIELDGSFRMCGLMPDRYILWVDYEGCRTPTDLDSGRIQAPATGVQLPISTALYRLTVSDARTHAKVDRARFHFDDIADFDCPIGDEGFIATDPSVEYPGRIVAEGYRTLRCSLPAIAPCEVRNLEFRLEPQSHLVAATIVVTSPTGSPVTDIEVKIRADAEDFDGQGPIPKMSHTAADGRHELPKLVPGTYELQIEPWRDGDPSVETWLGTVIELQVREGMQPVEIRLGEGGLVQATVTKQDGTPVDARTLLVRTPDSEPELIDWRNEAGTFAGWIPKQTIVHTAAPLPPGSWTLRFEADGCESQDVVVQIAAGDTTTLAVALEPEPPR